MDELETSLVQLPEQTTELTKVVAELSYSRALKMIKIVNWFDQRSCSKATNRSPMSIKMYGLKTKWAGYEIYAVRN